MSSGKYESKDRYGDPYFVEVDDNGCQKCGHGKNYTIVGPDGIGMGQSWIDPEEAQSITDELNDAFRLGQANPARKFSRKRKCMDWISDGGKKI